MTTSERLAWSELAGEAKAWVGNVPRVLGNESIAWMVKSGAVAVFFAEVRDGEAVGPRRFLFRLGEGHGFLSVPDVSGDHRFLVVPVVDSEIHEVALADLHAAIRDEATEDGKRALVDAIEEWILRLADLVEVLPQPDIVIDVEGDETVGLEAGWSVQPADERVVWVEGTTALCVNGSASQGKLEIEGRPCPLARRMWAEIRDEGSVRAMRTSAIPSVEELEGGVAWLQAAVLDRALRESLETEERDRLRLIERAREQNEREHAALRELAKLSEPRRARPKRETPLLTVMAAVGESIGVEIQTPPPSEAARAEIDPIDAIATASQVRTRRVRLSASWWRKDCGPLVGFREDEDHRPLALLPRRGRYVIYDPIDETTTALTKRRARELGPDAVMVYRPFPSGPVKLRKLTRFALAGRKGDLVFTVLVGLLTTILGMLTPQVTAWIMDDAIPDANRRLLFELALAVAAAAFGSALFSISQSLVLMRLGIATEIGIQAALWDRLLRLRTSFFRQYSTGDLQQRVSSITAIGQQFNGVVMGVVLSASLALLNVFLLLYYSPRLVVIAVLLAIVSVLITTFSSRAIRAITLVLLDKRGQFSSFVVEIVRGVSKLQVAGAEQRAYTQWLKRYTEILRFSSRSQAIEDLVTVFNQIVPTVGTICLFTFAAGQLVEPGSDMSLGTFLAFHAAFGTFIGALTGLSGTFIGLWDTVTRSQRIKPILEAEPESDPEAQDPGTISGRLAVRDLTFRYGEGEPLVLRGLSLHAEPGEFLAIVGPSGSGKSTLARLLLGFETPESGSISFDGQDLSSIDGAAVRRQIGVVLQAGKLTQGSIFANVSGGLAVTTEDVQDAIEAAGFAEDLAALPMGLHTMVSQGGGNLSGGQRQRLLIARALVLRPKILVLDEATSALDNKTQKIVTESLNARKVTRIVIAHRLSTVRNADRIYVLDGGRDVENGSFEELMSRGGLFAKLMKRQMG